MKKIVQISSPRSGSNLFCQMVEHFSNMSVKYEIFHKKDEWIMKMMREVCESEDPSPGILSFAKDFVEGKIKWNKQEVFKKKNIVKLIEEYMSCLGIENFYFKLFSEHLNKSRRYELISRCDGMVFIERNIIDSLISYEKALYCKEWSNANTSSFKIEFKPERYEWFKKRFIFPKNEMKDVAKNMQIPFFCIRYEDFAKLTHAEKTKLVKKLMLDNFNIDCGEFDTENYNYARFKKQDSSSYFYQKLSNPKLFREYYESVIKYEIDQV